MALFRPQDLPLRREVRRLGRLLGEVLVEQEGEALLALEEQVRQLAVARRRGPRKGRVAATRELLALLRSLPSEKAEPVLRAFSVYFQLVNLAEQHHRIRRTRAHQSAPHAPAQRGSVEAALQALRTVGVSAARAREALASLRVTLTLTAHPTQAVRRTVLEKLYRIHAVLREWDRGALTPEERDGAREALREEVTALWQTDELRRERPQVGDEVKNVLFYVEEVLFDLLPSLTDGLARSFERVYGEPLGPIPSPVRIHSWVGGDMDGNPRVTPEVLADTIRAHRARGLRKLLGALRELGERLSQSERRVPVLPALAASLEADAARLPGTDAQHRARTQGEPLRRKLRFMEARLSATLAAVEAQRRGADAAPSSAPTNAPSAAPGYASAEELSADLDLLARALTHARAQHAGLRQVQALQERVRAMGFHLAELELRAPAEDARSAAASLAAGGPPPSEGGTRLLASLKEIARAQGEGGEAACRTFILSMAETAEDVLAALAAARACGLATEDGAQVDVVPLLENRAALEGGPALLRALLAHPAYLRHVRARGVQEVMVGYSDSSKEVGLLAAAALLHRVQSTLPALAREAGVRLRLFHGRGESVARGGGPAQAAILALPPGSVAGHYKATEQGEAMDHKYANADLARRTLELILGGVLLHTLDAVPQPDAGSARLFAEALAQLGETGRKTYRALVWEDPAFVPFFQATTPVEELGELNIASRPAKRKAGGLEQLRAIPWVFGWTQNRCILPGWFGVGTALRTMRQSGPEGAALLARMYAEWPFFRTVVDNVEMVLAKSDLRITAAYTQLAPPETRHVWTRIQREHARTRAEVKRLTGSRRLLDGNPSLQRSIALRNPYVDPLSFLQVELLRRKRAGDAAAERPLLLSMGGIAQGLRNTG
jgi:phosphoenolpyruvate carboxylase